MKYKDGLRFIREMNVVSDVFGGASTIGQHGGSVGNDPDAWKNSYTNVPISYLHGDGKKKKSKKKKIPLYRRKFIESLTTESQEPEYILNCLLYTEVLDYHQLVLDLLEKYNIPFAKDENGIIIEGTDDQIRHILEKIQYITTSEPFENGDIIALLGEMDVSVKQLKGLAAGKTIDDLAQRHDVDINVVKNALQKGAKVELEHTSDIEIAKKIAMDHLWEDIEYYTKLAKIEKNK